MTRYDFIFNSVQLLYYKCHRINFRLVVRIFILQIGSKRKKATINLENKDDKCFQYAVMVALNYEKIKWNPDRISHIKPFINKYNWEEINYRPKVDDWETFE